MQLKYTKMSPSQTIEQRVNDLRAMMARYRITIKQVCDRAGLPYHSVRNNMRRFDVSDTRMTRIEEGAIEIREEIIRKKQGK